MRRGAVLGWWWLWWAFPLWASDSLSVRVIDTRQGLSQGMVYAISQDDLGFVWMGTKNGLDRYDGQGFVSYYHDPFEEFTLPEGEVLQVIKAPEGNLWIITSLAVAYYDRLRDRFYPLDWSAIPGPSVSAFTHDLTIDSNGDVWMTKAKGVYRLNAAAIQARNFGAIERVIDFKAASITYAIRIGSELWGIMGRRTLARWNTAKNEFEAVRTFSENIIGIDFSRNGWVWISTYKRDYILSGGQFYDFTLYAEREWLAGGYLNLFNLDDQRAIVHFVGHRTAYEIQFGATPDDMAIQHVYSLPPNQYVTCAYRDQLGNTWLGSNGYGATVLTPRRIQFKNVLEGRSISLLSSPAPDKVRARIYRDFVELDLSTGEIADLTKPMLQALSGSITNLLPERRDHQWALYSYVEGWDLETVHWVKFDAQYRILDTLRLPRTFDHVTHDEWGRYWMVASSGEYLRIDFEKRQVTRLTTQTPSSSSLHTYFNPLQVLQYDPHNRCLWKGTFSGLSQLQFDPAGQVIGERTYQNDPADPNSLSYNVVKSICNDPAQPRTYLWVGTSGGGLNRLHLPSGEFRHFTPKTGLPDKVIYGILHGQGPYLWLSTNKGLLKFHAQNFTYQQFVVEDGLLNDEFNTGAYLKHPTTSELFFGGINGLTRFLPTVTDTLQPQPRTWITSIKINNQPLKTLPSLSSPLPEWLDHLTLRWNQKHVSFQFATLDYSAPDRCQYRYRMVGIDKDWLNAGQNHAANYSNLKPGRYRFEVQGTNSAGVWSPYIDAISLTVCAPWWFTWWAYAAYVLGLVALIALMFNYRLRRLALQNKVKLKAQEAAKLQELDQLKTDFFTNITHELKTPLLLIQEPLLQALNRPEKYWRENVKLASKNTEKLIRLTNQLLELAKASDPTTQPHWEAFDLKPWITSFYESFLPLAHQKGIAYSLYIDTSRHRYLTDLDKLDQILRNLLSNAFKFTPQGGSVSLRLHHTSASPTLTIAVEDTGIGIPEDQLALIFNRFYQVRRPHQPLKGTGIGLSLALQLTQVLQGQLEVQSLPEQGSTFILQLPLDLPEHKTLGEIAQRPISLERHHAPTPAPVAIDQTPIPSRHLSTKVILIVEDHIELRSFMRETLAAHYQVITAENGHEGLTIAQRILPDLILSDALMPIVDGYTFCERIKANPATAHIPFVMLTAKTGTENELFALQKGVDAYIEKPFHSELLIQTIDNLLHRAVRSSQPASEAPHPQDLDTEFLQRVEQVIRAHLQEQDFTAETLALKMGYSRSQLHRKIKTLLNQSSTVLIRNIRLQTAKELLTTTQLPISDIAYQVGFTTPSYFSSRFKEYYGISPLEARQQGMV